MEDALNSLKREDGRKNNGCKPGEDRGQGRKPSAAKLREEAYEIMKAEFWVRLAQEKALPRLVKILENPDDSVAFKAAKEMLDRSLGKPKESIDHTSKGEKMAATNITITPELARIKEKFEDELRDSLSSL